MGNNKKAEEPVQKQLTKKEHARHRKYQRQQIIMFGALGAAILIAVGVLAWGAFSDYIQKPNATIASVNGVTITRTVYEKERNLELNSQLQMIAQAEQQATSQTTDPTTGQSSAILLEQYQQQQAQIESELKGLSKAPADSSTVDGLVQNELLRQKAPSLGIKYTDEDLKNYAFKQLAAYDTASTPTATPGASATATAAASPTPTQVPGKAVYDQVIANVKQGFGMSEQDYLHMIIEPSYLQEQVVAKLKEKVPTTAEEVHAAHILVATLDEANQIETQLKNGAAFEALAKDKSTDTGSKDQGGDLGWFPRGQMVAAFENAAFALKPGDISDPVKSDFGYHIIKVIAHEQNHQLDDSARTSMAQQEFSKWLDQQKTESKIETPGVAAQVTINPDAAATATATAGNAASPTPTASAAQTPAATPTSK
jgi:parvulin-like peptidyl-prolyl isomerase